MYFKLHTAVSMLWNILVDGPDTTYSSVIANLNLISVIVNKAINECNKCRSLTLITDMFNLLQFYTDKLGK